MLIALLSGAIKLWLKVALKKTEEEEKSVKSFSLTIDLVCAELNLQVNTKQTGWCLTYVRRSIVIITQLLIVSFSSPTQSGIWHLICTKQSLLSRDLSHLFAKISLTSRGPVCRSPSLATLTCPHLVSTPALASQSRHPLGGRGLNHDALSMVLVFTAAHGDWPTACPLSPDPQHWGQNTDGWI